MDQFESQPDLQNNLQETPQFPEKPKSGKKKLIIFVVGLLVVGFVATFLSLGGGGNFQGMYFNVSKVSEDGTQDSYTAEPKPKVYSAEAETESPKVYSAEPGVESETVLSSEPSQLLSNSAECFPEEAKIAQKEAITRIQFAKMLSEIMGIENSVLSEPIYNDVPSSHPCYKYAQFLGEKDIPDKYFGSILKPDLPLKRRTLVIWVVKAFDVPFVSVQGSSFPDVPTNASYSIYLEALNSWNAVLLPKGENRFFPDDDAQYGWAKGVVSVAKFMKAFNLIN